MATIDVREVSVQMQTVKLTKNVLKQLPRVTYDSFRKECFDEHGNEKSEAVIGWVHGIALQDEWSKYLLIRIREGEYGLMEAMDSTCKKYKQIIV